MTREQPWHLDYFGIVKAFDRVHEEIYSKGGIRPTNAAIDELCKFIFLKYHSESSPDYVLSTGSAKGRKFNSIFDADYVRKEKGKAITELQDAFKEVSTLGQYAIESPDGTRQTLFPRDEPLRLDNFEVVSMIISILLRIELGRLPYVSESGQQEVQHFDLLGLAFDVFLRGKYDSSGGLATYLTPNEVVTCMVRMAFADITNEEIWAADSRVQDIRVPAFLVGDTCCGTGRFLVSALNELGKRILADEKHSETDKAEWIDKIKKHSLVGADQAYSSLLKARINMLMFGQAGTRLLHTDDSITDENLDHLVGQFDLILTNPPFGNGKYTNQAGLSRLRHPDKGLELGWSWNVKKQLRKPLSKADPAILFLDRNLQLLKPGGRLLIILPDGIISSKRYEYVSTYLLAKAELVSVVSLPKQTFAMAGTAAKTSFIYLRKKSATVKPHKSRFLAVARHVGFMKKGTVMVSDPKGNDLEKISEEYSTYSRSQRDNKKSSRELSRDPLILEIPSSELQSNWDPAAYDLERIRARNRVVSLSPNCIVLRDVVAVPDELTVARNANTGYFISVLHIDERSNVDWHGAAKYYPSSKGVVCMPGDIIFSCINPSKPRVTVIPDNLKGQVLCSSEFAVLRTTGEDPYFVALALKADTSIKQISPLGKGTSSSRRRIAVDDLLSTLIPFPPAPLRAQLGRRFHKALEAARISADQVASIVSELESLYKLPHG